MKIAHQIIKDKWGGLTDRKGTPYIWHIDMGIAYMATQGSSMEALEAWCLHPLVQDFKDLQKNLKILEKISTLGAVYAVEYRHQANWYSTHSMYSTEPRKTLLKDVKLMLKADKLQNFWNLERNRQDHPNYAWLVVYFRKWFLFLNIPEDDIAAAFRLFDTLKETYTQE